MAERVVILGAGHAGGLAAITLRELGFSGTITVVGDETVPPYERPSLSKEFLSGADQEPVWLAPEEKWQALGVELRLGVSAEAIDRDQRRVGLSDGTALDYDHLILAMGGKVRALPEAEAVSDRVHYLRTTEDARALAAAARPGQRAVIVGGGVIGLEAASTLKGLGLSATVLETGERILGRNIPAEAADWLAQAHAREGIEIRTRSVISAMQAQPDGSVQVHLEGAALLVADLVIVGIGIIPCSQLAEQAGLSVQGGVVVGDDYRSREDARILAIGDLAVRQRGDSLGRMETWAHAQSSARAAALAIMNLPAEAEPAPWFWTAQCSHNLQILGEPAEGDSVIARGDHVRLYTCGGTLVGAVCLDQPRDFASARRLLGKTLNPELAADSRSDLRKAAA